MAQLVRLASAELEGISARIIDIEVDIHPGLTAFTIVGLADKSVTEAKERVNSAIKNSGFKPPSRDNRRVTINLAPGDVKKGGSHYDLGIAIGYLYATGQLAHATEGRGVFAGELSLDGSVRAIPGALNIALCAAQEGYSFVILPEANAKEASVVREIAVIPVSSLKECVSHLEGQSCIAPAHFAGLKDVRPDVPDLGDIKGQAIAKRALTIAAAGAHNLLMVGPPGVGKSYLASALAGILPPLTLEESIDVTKIYSAAGLNPSGELIAARPFRSPHQTSSAAALIGGGGDPKPGEISLAHNGVLFLDEFPEFQKNILESLRAPIEEGVVTVSRVKNTLKFPARFTLIAAMNPCPCGYWGDADTKCVCSMGEIARYQKKVSGPLLDRIDLQIRVNRVATAELAVRSGNQGESVAVREQIHRARQRQRARFQQRGLPIATNSQLSSRIVDDLVALTSSAKDFLARIDSSKISPRSYYRLIKTAATIADLEEADTVDSAHLAEAFGFRLKSGA